MNQLIPDDGNYETMDHKPYGHDAYGNKLEPSDGFAILEWGEKLQQGDWPFDVYSGWWNPGELNPNYNHHAYDNGRWRAWQRRILNTT